MCEEFMNWAPEMELQITMDKEQCQKKATVRGLEKGKTRTGELSHGVSCNSKPEPSFQHFNPQKNVYPGTEKQLLNPSLLIIPGRTRLKLGEVETSNMLEKLFNTLKYHRKQLKKGLFGQCLAS